MTIDVLSVSSEAVPLIKTGGLADVAGALPGALAPHGVKMTLMLPGYPAAMQAVRKGKVVHEWDSLLGEAARLVSGKIIGFPLLVLDVPAYFSREGSPYTDHSGHDWNDNWRRFAAFGRAAADLAAGAVKRRRFDVLHAHDWQAAMALAETDGSVRCIVGGRDYGRSQFNRASRALRQPGSSFKLYVYMTALLNGYTPDSTVSDAPICIGNWCPRNYSGGYSGRMPMITALTRSINTIPVRLSQQLGRDNIAEMAGRMGVKTPIRVSRSLALGPSEVTVLDQLAGYLTVASGGRKTPPYGIVEMLNTHGDRIYDHARDAHRRRRLQEHQRPARTIEDAGRDQQVVPVRPVATVDVGQGEVGGQHVRQPTAAGLA